jgi:acyl carrier protein
MSINIKNDITAMIAEHFGIDIAKLSPETDIASLGIDSLSMIEFMFQMEEKFNVQMADSRAPLATVADVVAEIERALAVQEVPQPA